MIDTGHYVTDKYNLPGLAIGVTSSENLICSKGFGFSEIETTIPMNPYHRQRIGSITKTMVGICVMSLVERGKISLDDRVKTFLPDIPFIGPADTLSIRNLMTHTGGIGEAPHPKWIVDPFAVLWSHDPPTQTVSDAYSDGVYIDVLPGTKWHYANHGFALLGEIISRIEGIPIEKILIERIFEPLGMGSTDCLDQTHKDLSVGYHRQQSYDQLDWADFLGESRKSEPYVDGINIRGQHVYVRPKSAGFVQSNIHDMAKFAQCLLNSGFPIISPETFNLMIKPHWCPDERLINMGLTFFRQERFGKFTFGHNGGITGGWNSNLTIIPEDDLGVMIHANINFEQFEDVVTEIVRNVLDQEEENFNSLGFDSQFASQAVGIYELPKGMITNFRPLYSTGRVQVKQAFDGSLHIKSRRGLWREGKLLIPRNNNDDTLLMCIKTDQPELPRILFVKDSDGLIGKIQFDRLIEMHKISSLTSW